MLSFQLPYPFQAYPIRGGFGFRSNRVKSEGMGGWENCAGASEGIKNSITRSAAAFKQLDIGFHGLLGPMSEVAF